MKDFHFKVTVIVMGLCFPGTVTNPPKKSSIFHNSEYQWDEHLLSNWSSTRHSSQIADTLGMSSHFFRVLFQSPMRKKWQIKRLDLSNHSISKMTLNPLAPLHALEILNLSSNAMHSLLLDLPLTRPSQQKHHRSSFHSRLPRLKVLILQRNQLSSIPKGLWKLKSLQSLDLSFNRIVHIGMSDFHRCLQLESIYLKSNKIRTVHPEAFRDLKKLQMVDLRSNALTSLAPIVTIALELPHLELELADNQWQCGKSNANFQNVTSASWRKKWDAICNMFVGNEKPYLETPQIRIPRDTHLPPTTSDMKSLVQSTAEMPQKGMDVHLPTLEKDAWVDYNDLKEIWSQPPIELRDSQDEHFNYRNDDDSPGLTLVICLSVISTFVVAFCLGAFVRPYIDKLWQQICPGKRPSPENAYSNEGFYDEVEAPQRVEPQGIELHHASDHSNLYERQNPSWVTEPTPHGAVMSERVLGDSRMDLSSQHRPAHFEDNTATRSTDCYVLPYSHMVHLALRGLSSADTHELSSAVHNQNHVPEELHYDTVTQEYSLHEGVMDGSPIAVPLGTVPHSMDDGCYELCLSRPRDVVTPVSKTLVDAEESSFQEANAKERFSDVYDEVPYNDTRDDGCYELCLSRPRDVVTPVSKTLVDTNAQRSEESKEKGCPEPLGTMDSPMESSEERPVSSSLSGLAAWQSSFWEANAKERFSDVYEEVLKNDPRDIDLPSLLPRWGSGPHVTPATEEPVLRDAPFDPLYDLVANYESDSDEGSLFTLSSEASEDISSLPEEQASKENGGAAQPLPNRNLRDYQDDVTSVLNDEDITSQMILKKCELLEAHFGNSFIFGPESFV
ncbi:leucine-rich repeat-containing protein 66 [Sigmodon hispidus]